MTIWEAKHRIIRVLPDDFFAQDDRNRKALSIMESALEKQIRKKPYLLNCGGYEVENWHCPNGHIVYQKDAFCKHCGQALDWSDSE